MHDLVIRRGIVVDGTGAERRVADVAVDGGRIVGVGRDVGRGRREIDADGLLVTPGFVDIHTHYDGQATWDSYLEPSSLHEIGRASGRERVCQYVYISVVAVSLKKKK